MYNWHCLVLPFSNTSSIPIALKEWLYHPLTCCGLSELRNSKSDCLLLLIQQFAIQLSASLDSTAESTWHVTRPTTLCSGSLSHIVFRIIFTFQFISRQVNNIFPFLTGFQYSKDMSAAEEYVIILRTISPDVHCTFHVAYLVLLMEQSWLAILALFWAHNLLRLSV